MGVSASKTEYSQCAKTCQPKWQILVDEWLEAARAVVWQPTCVLCGGAGAVDLDLCAHCETEFPINGTCCGACAQPLTYSGDVERLCGACLQRQPHFDTSFAPYRYLYPIDRLIQRLKYGSQLSIGRVLGELFARRLLATRTHRPAVLIPVPLAAGRFRERGYNQAIELAQQVARRTEIELRTDIVIRARETQEQASLKRKQRRRNVRGAFEIVKDLPEREVAILDDVMTTGSTANELAKTLRAAGAERIEVWTIARAGK